MWRCAKNIISYCKTEPQWEKQPDRITAEGGLEIIRGGICALSPDSCGNCLASQEAIPDSEQLLHSSGVKTSYISYGEKNKYLASKKAKKDKPVQGKLL